jgi:O-antigen/teichoic acid export membrane protein
MIFLSPLQEILLPLLSESAGTEQGTHQLVHRSIKYALIGAIVFAAAGWILSPFIYNVVFEYPAAAPIYRTLLFCLPVYALALHQRPMFYALKGQKYLVISILFSIIWLTLVTSLCLIWLGVIGAAMGLFANVFAVWVLRYASIRRLEADFHIVWRDLLRIEGADRKLFTWIWEKAFRR